MTASQGLRRRGAGSCPGFAADSSGLTLIPLNMAELDLAGSWTVFAGYGLNGNSGRRREQFGSGLMNEVTPERFF
jgi:hypothetical protein